MRRPQCGPPVVRRDPREQIHVGLRATRRHPAPVLPGVSGHATVGVEPLQRPKHVAIGFCGVSGQHLVGIDRDRIAHIRVIVRDGPNRRATAQHGKRAFVCVPTDNHRDVILASLGVHNARVFCDHPPINDRPGVEPHRGGRQLVEPPRT